MNTAFDNPDPFNIARLGRVHMMVCEINNGYIASVYEPEGMLPQHFFFKEPADLGGVFASYIATVELKK